MRPNNPQTLSRLNKAAQDRFSDHHPILVDLEPSLVTASTAPAPATQR
jgi:hypothetical protein